MRRKIIVALIGILLVGVVVGGLISNNNRDISLTAGQRTALANIGITNYTTKDFVDISLPTAKKTLDGNAIHTYVQVQTYYENCSASFNPTTDAECPMIRTYYTEQEIQELLDDAEEQLMKKIADNQIIRDEAASPTQTGGGTTTIK